MTKILAQTKIQLFLIIFLTILAYSNIFRAGFVIDDNIFVSQWAASRNLSDIGLFLKGDVPTNYDGVYRPIRSVFYVLSYSLFGENAHLYHIQAVLVHLAVTVLVYLVTLEIWKFARGPFGNGSSVRHFEKAFGQTLSKTRNNFPDLTQASARQDRKGNSVVGVGLASSSFSKWLPSLPFLTALLFGLHPIHTEAIDYVTASFDNIAAIFFFGSIATYLYALRLAQDKRMYANVTSVILAGVAFFTFEMTLTLPLLLTLLEFCFRRKDLKNNTKNLVPYYILAGFYVFVRVVVLQITSRGEYLVGSFYLTMLTMVKAIVVYISLLIFPFDLSLNQTVDDGIYSWVHPLSPTAAIAKQSIFDLDILFFVGVLLAILFLAVVFFKKKPIVTFSIGWFFISLLPVLYIIPQGPVMQERYVYIGSFGWCLLAVYILNSISNIKYPMSNIKYIPTIILVLLLVFYGSRTFLRNRDWKDSFAIWSSIAAQIPSDVISNYYVAGYYKEKKMNDVAIGYYYRVLATEDKLYEAHNALGEIYLSEGRLNVAIVEFKKALSINPKLGSALNTLNNLELFRSFDNYSSKLPVLVAASINLPAQEINLETKGGLIFKMPLVWQIMQDGKSLVLENAQKSINIKITELESWEIASQKAKKLGSLVNQGSAQLPNFEKADVKIWEDQAQKVVLLQFFLYKQDKVIEVIAIPASNKEDLDKILGSMKVTGE